MTHATVPEPTETEHSMAVTAAHNALMSEGVELTEATRALSLRHAAVVAQLNAEVRFLRGLVHPVAVPKGETVPQTVENLQAIMARDAVALEEAHKALSEANQRNDKLARRVMKLRNKGT